MRIGVSSNDAGAANLISYFVKNSHKSDSFIFNLDGPALNIFNKVLGGIKTHDIQDVVMNSDVLISGTGWQSRFEHDARSTFKSHGKKIISVLDHWINYKERFKYEKEDFLSDEIWVFDKYAFDLAHQSFPDTLIKLKKNYYLEHVLAKIENFQEKNIKESFLYVLEPCRETKFTSKGDEHTCIDLFFKYLNKNFLNDTQITFRPHPSERTDKYNYLYEKYPMKNILIDNDQSLELQIANSTHVVGVESMALYIAYKANKNIICTKLKSHDSLKLPIDSALELRNVLHV